MLRSSILFLLVLSPAWLLPSCDRGWPDVYWKSGRYTLIAIDTLEQMSLAHGSNARNLVGSTVFSVGADEKYIVLKQHPSTAAGGLSPDRTITRYFIVKKIGSSEWREVKEGVRGPLKKEEFEQLAASLKLPPFTTTFDKLR